MASVRSVPLVVLASIFAGAWPGGWSPAHADGGGVATTLNPSLLPSGPAAMPSGPAAMPATIPAQVSVADVMPYGSKPEPTVQLNQADLALTTIRLTYPLGSLAESMDPWGWRYSSAKAAWRMHTGVDLAAATGTPVLAALAGRVLLVGSVSGYGTTVLLDHGNGLETLYAHLSQASVHEGDSLEQGVQLGAVGMSGAASGPHLHFELRQRGAQLQAIDPTPHLPPLMAPPVLAAR